MSHDLHATWAAAAVATYFQQHPEHCFRTKPESNELSIYAGREGRTAWPFADGAIGIELGGRLFGTVALEFKRENEGVHGMLTALGQAFAYLHKGYAGVAVVIPQRYPTHSEPGQYLRNVLAATSPDKPIGIFVYADPDRSLASPYLDKLSCFRGVQLGMAQGQPVAASSPSQRVIGTQWAHLREGSSTPSAFFEYLRIARNLGHNDPEPLVDTPAGLEEAVRRVNGDLLYYLSNAPGRAFHDKVWRHFWFSKVLTREVMEIWQPKDADSDTYEVNDVPTKLVQANGVSSMTFFSYRDDSIKREVVRDLNQGIISEAEAWSRFADNIHGRAHSYREDIDSGLEHLGLLTQDGRPSELGYRFVDAIERSGSLDKGTPRAIFGAVLLQIGQFGAFLHYIHRLSEAEFTSNPLSFASIGEGRIRRARFDRSSYLKWLEGKLADELHVMRKVSVRGGQRRQPFQAELRVLSQFGFIPEQANQRFRVGVGLVVNWQAVQEAMALRI